MSNAYKVVRDIEGNLVSAGDRIYFTYYGWDHIRKGVVKDIDSKWIYIDDDNAVNDTKISHSKTEHRILKRK